MILRLLVVHIHSPYLGLHRIFNKVLMFVSGFQDYTLVKGDMKLCPLYCLPSGRFYLLDSHPGNFHEHQSNYSQEIQEYWHGKKANAAK